ncbi:hypothetical protein B0A75_11095 [Flavobacterium oncorhynchi]|uniref:N-acetyltransferase domain-containing protein n=1 Tax=Flavobacterium oncorhynchi TaxID=728056 RepID=A0A226I0Q0_9FLAO|nr:N-acetyltransferase [Flavobacterium oncorhynchi]OXA99676.1 hypothetical protein B0A75_11095 [Flavobacterium oncorhynchi]
MSINIRPYNASDKEDISDIFFSNCPKYFDKNDHASLLDFLDNYADKNFKVLISDDKIIGCGGYYIKDSDECFGICWVMFKRYVLGHRLFFKTADMFFNHLMQNIESENLNYDIVINTTQVMEKSFNRYGFKTESVSKNGFGEGLDHYKMRRGIEL